MRRSWMVPMVLMVAGALVACGGGDGESTAESGGSTLVWARGADSTKLDPAVVTDGESVKVISNVFDTLVRFEPGTLDLRPGLAESWSVAPDGLLWTFQLRDAKFHDGTPVDAEAVKFSFDRQRDSAHPGHTDTYPYYLNNFGLITDVRAKDAKTVEIQLSQPDAAFLAKMTLFSSAIVSPTAFASQGTGADGKYSYPFHEQPIGSGPFKFVRWDRDNLIVLEANPDYWDGPPGVDRLMFKVIGDNNQRLIALESGQAHIMDGVNPQHADRVTSGDDLVLSRKPALNIAYFAMNNDKPPFDDARVRQAVAFAIDKENIRKAAYDGRGDLAVVPVPVGMPGRADLTDRKRDVAKAKELLAAAGHPDGFEMTLTHGDNPRPYMPRPRDVATQIQQDLAEVGIVVKVEQQRWTPYLEATQNGEHQACLLGWSADYGDPDNFLYVLLHEANTEKGTANNISFYRSSEVSELLSKARVEVDRDARMAMYAEAQQKIFDDAPMVPLMQMPDLRVLSPRVQGYVIYPAGGEYLHSVKLSD